ncbi:hypothetical protein DH2020_045017 [Rehmannia glutinosa]|uniref:DYW domain-containing protein n=1 Tax=Rehmannia glutinosa TaxID=99300 RepID=A0ABR0UFB8_REHGL
MPQSHLSTIALQVTSTNQVKQFHAHLIRNALHRHSFWVPRLIAFCTRFHAPPPYARRVFDSAHQPSVFAFTNMLRYYYKWGSNQEVLSLFDEMRQCNLKPDPFAYPVLIKAAGKSAVLFHSELIKRGHDCGMYIRNALVNAYGTYGPIEAARQVFDEMTDRSVRDWNSIIWGYWNLGDEGEAKRLFDLMLDKNVVTWTTMVTGYSKMKDLESARSYFDRMPEKTVVSWNAMLSGYAQNGFTEEALSLFRRMVSVGVSPNETTWVTVISSCSSHGDPGLIDSVVKILEERGIIMNPFIKTALLDSYAKCGRLEMARKIFNELGVCRNLVAWNSMISAYTRTGDLISARELFDQMLEKDVVTWNSMIAGYAQNGQSALAIELFKQMINERVVMPNEVTVVSVISACGHLGALELGYWVMEFITANGVKLSMSAYSSLIYMYSRCGSMNEAKMIFHEMEKRDAVSHNALITGLAAHGNGIEALKFLRKMKDEGIEPDRITYIGVLTACSHSGMLEEGKKVFESIEAPDRDHYACMVDLLGRVGKLDEAKRMIEEMPMRPHAGIYGSLLNASRIHKRLDLGEFAANKLFELEPENSGNYILLSNMYASAGKWKNVDRIRKLMKTRGLMTTTGWSRVEHDRKMHKFTVGDRSHEKSVEIYSKLAELNRKLQGLGYVADKSNASRDVEDEEKEEMVGTHSEKLAVAFGLLVSEPGTVIRVVKNIRICLDCHTAIKMISKLEEREIIVRDNNRFHHFKDNVCSCNDYW